MPTIPKAKVVDDAVTALDGVRREWLRRPGVTAVDVGYKISGDEITNDVALRVHVARKLPVAELATSEVFNESGGTPAQVGGFPVDVIEATYGPSQGPAVLDYEEASTMEAIDRKSSVDPLIGGVSCGNTRVTAGTIGAIVFDKATCKPMILSNWHVLAGASAAAVGEPIVQPGRIDGGTETVATLTRMVLDSRMDAAVATLNGARANSRDLLGLGTINGIETATLGMAVTKSGRTTGITEGIIDGVSMSVSINYTDPGVVSFSNQIRIVPKPPWPGVDYEVSQGGDSGSVWINPATNNAIGLHFAGENDPTPSSENAICNPMGAIATEFNFSFLPVLCRRPVPMFDICDRYPWLCRPFEVPWERFRWPLPDPPPFDPRGPVSGPGPIRGLGGGLQSVDPSTAGAASGDCGCGGHGAQSGGVDPTELAELLTAYFESRRR